MPCHINQAHINHVKRASGVRYQQLTEKGEQLTVRSKLLKVNMCPSSGRIARLEDYFAIHKL